jgi:DNA-binding NtrC family response regulator
MATILVTDDDTICRESIVKTLERGGHIPEGASDVDEALRAIERKHFDLIVCDYRMPGKTGLDLLIKLAELGTRIPVLMVSAVADPQAEAAAMKLGVVALLKKPVRRQQLLEYAALALQ